MQILPHENKWAVCGDRLDKAPPGGERLLPRGGLARVDPEQRQQARPQPGELLDVGQNHLQLLGCYLGRVGLIDTRVRLHDLPQRPERNPIPIGQTPPLPPADDLRMLVDISKQLSAEAALPDPRLTDQRHELRLRVTGAPLEQALQKIPLNVPTDERARLRPDQIRTEPRPRLNSPEERHRL